MIITYICSGCEETRTFDTSEIFLAPCKKCMQNKYDKGFYNGYDHGYIVGVKEGYVDGKEVEENKSEDRD